MDAAPSRRLASRLRFRHLQLLVELERTGSLRAASGVLNLTQPALSKALVEIEGAFGHALFRRSPRGLQPTAEGTAVLRGAAMLLRQLEHVGDEVASGGVTTQLRVGAPPFVAQGYLPAILRKLTKSDARMRVQLHEERVPALLDRLLDGQLDALVSTVPAELPEAAERQLDYEYLFDAEFAIIAPVAHPLARLRQVNWHQLADASWIMPTRTSMVRTMLAEMFRRQSVAMPTPVVESTSPFTNLRLVATGLGISAVPVSVGRPGPLSTQVKQLKVVPPIESNPVALISRRDFSSPGLDALRAVLAIRRRRTITET